MNIPTSSELAKKIDDISAQMSAPATIQNAAKMKELAGQLTHARGLQEVVEEHERVSRELTELSAVTQQDDAELYNLAQTEIPQLQEREQKLTEKLRLLLVPPDPRDSRDVILEIRAGAGGEEAALFAAELFRAYSRYCELHGWRVHVVHQSMSEQAGYKEIIAEISGDKVFGTLKFERGVHRVQRIPETEKQGRIHTSTITVAVLPQAQEVDIEIKPEDLRIDTYRASGAGGQHVNKTSSAVRITHVPTNTVVAVQDERSQHKNKAKAMSILRARLLEEQERKKLEKQSAARKSQIGTGDRSEKIRTYNFPQDRITDHRIKKSWSNIEGVMDGQMEQIFKDITEEDSALKMGSV